MRSAFPVCILVSALVLGACVSGSPGLGRENLREPGFPGRGDA